jgi:hypothetical protein
MQRRLAIISAACAAAMFLTACTGGGSGGASASPSPSAVPAQTALPANAKTPVTFTFSDVSVATAGAHTLRLGFTLANGSADPQLCDPSEFSIQLDDGTVIQADASADNTCTPDSVDPSTTGNVTMFFDLPASYAGGVTLMMIVDDKIIGQGSTTLK